MLTSNTIIVKVKVLFDVTKPLKSRISISDKKEVASWIEFRHEKLPMFFYNCGIVGRNDEFCPQDTNKATNSERHNMCEGWTKATDYGRKIKYTV